jgi:glycosyltransferase involved in cell wall biosynthesis
MAGVRAVDRVSPDAAPAPAREAAPPAAREKVTAFVITLNEEENIASCLESVSWADEILVVDSFSSDRTCDLARERGAKVIQRRWNGINEQRQAGLEHCAHDWVLCLDADERVSHELRDEILRCLRSPSCAAWEITRHTRYLGRWINHCGWFPDWKLRLFRKSVSAFTGTDPHDHVSVEGSVGRLKGKIHHYTYRNFAHQIRTINSFSETASARLAEHGRRFSLLALLVRPPWKFFEVYIWKLGFLDGVPGLVISIASAFNVFSRYVKLWERTRLR